ncbi:MAG: hypothetical protein D6689_00990 [Deltaproteobacteria bacterium]|nr:MAG: hypothetical protein D6689_00990 [Deltaproteobacteria bacterium]
MDEIRGLGVGAGVFGQQMADGQPPQRGEREVDVGIVGATAHPGGEQRAHLGDVTQQQVAQAAVAPGAQRERQQQPRALPVGDERGDERGGALAFGRGGPRPPVAAEKIG